MNNMSDERLDGFKKALDVLRDENDESLRNITLANIDEVMVSYRIANDQYCDFSCSRCPHSHICTEGSRHLIVMCLEYDIYHGLFGRFSMEEYLFVRNVVFYCLDNEMGIDEIIEYFNDNFEIIVDGDELIHTMNNRESIYTNSYK